jgi:hypothetical protein
MIDFDNKTHIRKVFRKLLISDISRKKLAYATTTLTVLQKKKPQK